MSWLCDACGYENEFNDETQPTACLCCGEAAPKNKIAKARQELNAYHREEVRKAYIEKQKRMQELWQKKMGGIAKGTIRMTKALSFTMTVIIVISLIGSGVSLYSQNAAMEVFSTLSENAQAGAEVYINNCLGNVKMIEALFSEWNENFSSRMVVIVENTGSNLGQIGEQIPVNIQNIGNSFLYMKSNCRIFWNRARRNVQELIILLQE